MTVLVVRNHMPVSLINMGYKVVSIIYDVTIFFASLKASHEALDNKKRFLILVKRSLL